VTVDDAYADFAEHAWPSLRRHGVPVVLFVPTAFAGDPEAGFWWDRAHAALLGGIRAGLDSVTTTALGTVELGAGPARPFERIAARLKAMPHEAMVAAVDELIATLSERLVATIAPLSPARSRRAILDWDALRRLAAEGVALAPHGRTHALLDRVPPLVLAEELAGSRRDLERETGSSLPLFAYPGGQHDRAAIRAVAAAGFAAAFTTQRGTNDLRSADPLRLRRINVGGSSGVSLLRAQLVPAAVRLSSARDR
jgi:peptidoglycan/xylan/chitin deacetylase (PgdA/CDA1 family)